MAVSAPSLRTVADVMTHAVVAVGRGAPFKDIVATMRKWNVSALPVLEGDSRVVGVVSEADLLAKEAHHDAPPRLWERPERMAELEKSAASTAGDLMTAPAVSVSADAPISEAARIMAWRRVKRLPVVDRESRLVGIVSRADLLRVFLRGDDDLAREIRRDVLGMMPGELSHLGVQVRDGVVTLAGELPDPSMAPVLARLVRSVEGVVDVRFEPEGSADRPGEEHPVTSGAYERAREAYGRAERPLGRF